MNISDLKNQLEKTVDYFLTELSSIHTGRASALLVDGVTVEVYGSKMPLKQLANISATDSKSLSIQPWDKSNLQLIEKAVRESDLGLSPINDGNVIRLNIPELTEDRRKEYVRIAKEKAEDAKVGVRNHRRDILEFYKTQKNNNEISENEFFSNEKEIQKIVDDYNKKIDEILEKKEKELTEI